MRISRAVAAAISAAAMTGALPVAAAAPAPKTPAATASSAAPVPDAAVRLITGDRVTVSDGADGTPSVTFDAAPRPGGGPVTYAAFGHDGHFYVVPSDVAPLVPDKLDLGLFDVLAIDRLQDGGGALPVIVQAATPAGARTAAKPAWSALDVDPERTLESIDAVAGEVPADGAPALVDAVEAGKTIEHVWLDAPVTLLDADSTPQIGAPAAWAAGDDGTGVTVAVLDTGIDTTHPDLDDGVVTLAKDFTGSGSTADAAGHGTHVASIIAGSGEASDGVNRGVAPGAHLLNGRVLNAQGEGEESWVIDAMEWAASNGADVINMSLGVEGEYTDGTDPGALAIDSISERYDTLVVVAAGNDGQHGSFTVTTPGTADSALTVGAVTDSGSTAYFSSTGPRAGDYAIKPDIAAPGDGIVAARAAGTTPEEPVGDWYAAMSGTSMAAPHVAGAAAILKSARPGLDGEALKSVLMGSAHAAGNPVFAEGSGQVWVPGAIAENVYATPASLSFGLFDSPRADQAPKTKTVTYTNDGDTDAELHLSLSVAASDGVPVPAREASLSADVLTVPAHGTASVDVTIDPQADEPDVFAGVLSATGPGFPPVRTVMAFQVNPDMYTLRIEATRRGGLPAANPDSGWIYGIDDPDVNQWFQLTDGVAEVRLPVGRYAILGELFDAVSPSAQFFDSVTTFTRDVDLQDDVTVRLDGSTGVPARVDVPKKTVPRAFDESLVRRLPGRSYPVITDVSTQLSDYTGGVDLDAYVLPSDGPVAGQQSLHTRFLLDQPMLDVSVTGAGKPLDVTGDLHPAIRSPQVLGKLSARLVDAGTGTPAELAAAGVRGAVALVEDTGDPLLNEQSQAAHDAGAVALVVYGATPGPFYQTVDNRQINTMSDQAVPTLTVARDVGLQLLAAAHRGGRLQGTGIASPTYQYALAYLEQGHEVPPSLTYRAKADDLATVDVDVRTFAPGHPGTRTIEWLMMGADGTYAGFPYIFHGPLTDRTVYFSTQPGVTFQRTVTSATGLGVAPAEFTGPPRTYSPGRQPAETYVAQVHHGGLRPSPAQPQDAAVFRDGDVLSVNLPYRVDGAGNVQSWGPDQDSTGRFRIWQGDQVLTDDEWSSSATPQVGDGPFRIQLHTHRDTDWWPLSTDVTTEWGFTSSTTAGATVLPLLQLDYGVQGLDGDNVGGRTTRLNLHVSHQDGSTRKSAVTGLSLWSSVDGGSTWTPVKVTAAKGSRAGDGAYTASVTAPAGATTVSLRSQAQDAAGATFTETVIGAYAVAAGAHG
jgi:subtilisin family serine protease